MIRNNRIGSTSLAENWLSRSLFSRRRCGGKPEAEEFFSQLRLLME
jgi:hypothetical protein